MSLMKTLWMVRLSNVDDEKLDGESSEIIFDEIEDIESMVDAVKTLHLIDSNDWEVISETLGMLEEVATKN